jgi:nucleotide-binding universal stress UspA family protein
MGRDLACGAWARAILLHVVHALPAMYAGLKQMKETLEELLQSEPEKARELREAAEIVDAQCDSAQVKLRRGIVADEILREGLEGDYDLIVLGSPRPASGLVRVLMGDVSRKVFSRAQRPLLVVAPGD